METVQFQSSGLSGAKGMMQDIFSYLKFAISTKIGRAITILCMFLALLVLLITGCFSTFSIIFTVLVFLAFIVFSFFAWFKENNE